MAATPPNGDKPDGRQRTILGRNNKDAAAAQPSKTNFKAQLDQAASESQSGGHTTDPSDGMVSKLIGQGKQLLGLSNSEDSGNGDGNGKAAASTPEPHSENAAGITDDSVHEFLRDAHRSQKVTTAAAEGL